MKEPEPNTEIALNNLPIQAYRVDLSSYRWPRKNRCTFCMVGKFTLVKDSSILLCKVCEAEFHIPYLS